MSTELMNAKNDTGQIYMTGMHRDGKRRYQLRVLGKIRHPTGSTRQQEWEVVCVDVDAETIANMQRCVNHYETAEI